MVDARISARGAHLIFLGKRGALFWRGPLLSIFVLKTTLSLFLFKTKLQQKKFKTLEKTTFCELKGMGGSLLQILILRRGANSRRGAYLTSLTILKNICLFAAFPYIRVPQTASKT